MSSYSYLQKHRSMKRKRTFSSSGDSASTHNNWEVTSSFSDYTNNSAEIGDNRDISINSGKINVSDNASMIIGANINSNLEMNSGTSLFDVSIPLASSSVLESSRKSNDSNRFDEHVSSDNNSDLILLSHDETVDDAEPSSPAVPVPIPFREKLKRLCLENISIIKNNFISKLLVLLKEHGLDVPTCAATLLGTNQMKSHQIKAMLGHRGMGSYVYFGIRESLLRRITSDMLKDNIVKVVINIDGMEIYNNSKEQFWPILMHIYHEEFLCRYVKYFRCQILFCHA